MFDGIKDIVGNCEDVGKYEGELDKEGERESDGDDDGCSVIGENNISFRIALAA